MKNLHNDLEEAFNIIGTSMYSDDFCCKLLAWLYVFGGGCEATVLNKTMFAAIQVAQKRLNLIGGEVPNAKLLPFLQKYMKEAEYHEKGVEEASWVNEICTRYGISIIKFVERTPDQWKHEVFYTQRPEGGGDDNGHIRIPALFGPA